MARTASFLRWTSYVLGLLLLAQGSIGWAEQPPLGERVDQLIESAHQGPVSPPVTDAEFLRRVSLDLIGMIPSADEVRTFLRDPADNKREQLVDRLLASPDHARHLTHVYDLVLMERRNKKSESLGEWREYLRSNFASNRPFNEIAGELLSSDGTDPTTRGASSFLLDRNCESDALTRDVGRLFFGMDLQCAQCHDHPLVDDYKQADYYGLKAFLNRTYVFKDGDKQAIVADKPGGETKYKSVFTDESADKVTPRMPRGAAMEEEPKFAKGEEYQIKPAKNVRPVPKFSRRIRLAQMVAEGKNAAFQRNIANRVWAQLFGRGLVHPVDFQHPDNPPSHPELLELLAREFVASDYDLRQLMRTLVLTRAYQRSCQLPADSEADKDPAWDQKYVTGLLKPLSAEQMAFSVLRAMGTVEAERAAALLALEKQLPADIAKAPKEERPALIAEHVETAAYGKLATAATPFLQLYDTMPSQNFQATVNQALFFSNSDAVQACLKPAGNNLTARLSKTKDAVAVADELYLSILSRYPTDEERAAVAAYLQQVPKRTLAVEEMVWGLLSSSEFRFNH